MTHLYQAKENLYDTLLPRFGPGESRMLTRILLEDLLGWRPAQTDRALSEDEVRMWQRAIDRLLAGEPVQYITGRADFYGYSFLVTASVLIPRPETEELVEWVLQSCRTMAPPPGPVLDIGTGSGCIPITLALEGLARSVTGVDISEAALQVAAENAQVLKADVNWLRLDILAPEAAEQLTDYAVIISNPPYIPLHERELMPEQVLAHEPKSALFVPDEDPLLFYRAIAQLARTHLRAGGYLFFECNEHTATDVVDLLQTMQFAAVELKLDLQGKPRMVRALQPMAKDN